MKFVVNKIVKSYNISNKTYETNEKNIIILQIKYTKLIYVLHKLSFH